MGRVFLWQLPQRRCAGKYRIRASPLQRGEDRLELTATVPAERGPLRIGLSVVVEAENISYWALRHAPGKPDFHHPDAFALELQ